MTEEPTDEFDPENFDPEEFDVADFDEEVEPLELEEFEPEMFDLDFDQIFYPSVEDIRGIHHDIISEDEDASSGTLNGGQIDFTLNCIEHGHFGQVPDTIHEKAFTLMRLLAANHAFADGNKRTALNTTWTFYAMNGYYFDYGEEIKAILKLLAVKQEMVDQDQAIAYFGDIARGEDEDRAPTEFVKMNRLFNWYDSVSTRIKETAAAEVDPSEIDQEYVQKRSEIVQELLFVASELVRFREEYHKELPQETIEYIDSIAADTQIILDVASHLSKMLSSAESEEEFERRLDEFDPSELEE